MRIVFTLVVTFYLASDSFAQEPETNSLSCRYEFRWESFSENRLTSTERMRLEADVRAQLVAQGVSGTQLETLIKSSVTLNPNLVPTKVDGVKEYLGTKKAIRVIRFSGLKPSLSPSRINSAEVAEYWNGQDLFRAYPSSTRTAVLKRGVSNPFSYTSNHPLDVRIALQSDYHLLLPPNGSRTSAKKQMVWEESTAGGAGIIWILFREPVKGRVFKAEEWRLSGTEEKGKWLSRRVEVLSWSPTSLSSTPKQFRVQEFGSNETLLSGARYQLVSQIRNSATERAQAEQMGIPGVATTDTRFEPNGQLVYPYGLRLYTEREARRNALSLTGAPAGKTPRSIPIASVVFGSLAVAFGLGYVYFRRGTR